MRIAVTTPTGNIGSRVVQKLLDAGATITGKTICDEFFYSIAGANAHYGTPVNPRGTDVARIPGGSSSGAGVAVVISQPTSVSGFSAEVTCRSLLSSSQRSPASR